MWEPGECEVSQNKVYSNIVRIDTYYEVAVNTTLTNLMAYVNRDDGTTAYYENGRILTRPQERIFAIDNDASSDASTKSNHDDIVIVFAASKSCFA